MKCLARILRRWAGRLNPTTDKVSELVTTALASLRCPPWTWTHLDHSMYVAALDVMRRTFGLNDVRCTPQDDGHHFFQFRDLTVVSHPDLPALVVLAAQQAGAPAWVRALSDDLLATRRVWMVQR